MKKAEAERLAQEAKEQGFRDGMNHVLAGKDAVLRGTNEEVNYVTVKTFDFNPITCVSIQDDAGPITQGYALCSPDDKWDLEVGRAIAAERAFKQLARLIKKDANNKRRELDNVK